MNISEYQSKARSTAIYLEEKDSRLIYPALGLVGECGEIADKIKKTIRGDGVTPKSIEAIGKELGDCCWYLANICCDVDLDLGMIDSMSGAHMIAGLKKLNLPQLVLRMCRLASLVAEVLEQWHYLYDNRPSERCRFIGFPRNLSEIISCIKEIASRHDFTLEEIYTANIEKLTSRKERGKLRGSGDDR